MFIVILRLLDGARARELMEAHSDWIRRGFDDGVFLLVGSLQGEPGGGILAHGESHAELERRVQADPFVENEIAEATIIALAPNRTDPRLAFLGS